MRPRRRGSTVAAEDRGQLVLVAAGVLAVAVVTLAFAYLQLGYHGDVRAESARASPGSETVRLLERAVRETARDAPRRPWPARSSVARAVNDSLSGAVADVEAAQVDRGVATVIRQNATAAATWAGANCPYGDGRNFGRCETTGGLVLQKRAGETHLVAVAFDVHLVDDRGETDLTVVVRVVGGVASG